MAPKPAQSGVGEPSRPFGFTVKPVVATLLYFCSVAAIAETRFASACEKLAAEAEIRVIFEDRQLTRDDSRSLEVLKRLSKSGPNPHHSVLGVTHAEPIASLDITPRILSDADGSVCGVPSLTLKLSFATLQVYLASELKDNCRRRIVEEHEQEHVAVWRNHFRAGARVLEPLLRRKLAQAAYFSTPLEAREALQQRVNELVVPLLKNLNDGIGVSQQEIDSAGSYRYVEGRMRACP